MLAAILMSSCSINSFIPEDKSLVQSNKVVIEGENDQINKSDLEDYISLKPYKTTFQIKLPNWIYYQYEDTPNSKTWKWLNEKFGREPIYYDETEANNSAKQMMRYLNNVGYFHSTVKHKVDTKDKRSRVTYIVTPTQPYYVNNINYIIEDSLMHVYIMRDSTRFPIKAGDIYNSYALDDIRDIITERLKNSGYYYFNRDNIYYEVDSNFMNHTLSVTMKLKMNQLSNKKYYIRDISVYPDFSVFRMNDKPADSAQLQMKVGPRKRPNTLDFYYLNKPNVKPQTFSSSIHVYEGYPYNLRSVTSTYKALGNYRLFRNVNIEFDTVANGNDSINQLDCRITMQQSDIHSFTVQAEGTNSDGDLGIKGNFSYTNRNIFRGAETFQLSFKAGLEAQSVSETEGTEQSEGEKKIFNTKELGITASLLFPKFLSPFPLTNFVRDYQPTTTVTLGFNAQIRYYYSRYITTASFNYDWKSNYRTSHTFSPLNLNSVKIANINPIFEEYLENETSQRKKDQYTDHFILGARYSYIYNSQRFNQEGSFFYIRADIESSGNLLSLFNRTKLMTENGDYHELFGIRYAQYVRGSFDLREHLDLGSKNWFVFRQFIGLGIPYGNSKDMPFERSFYGGGANGLRGWLYRSVGPGGLPSSDNDFERIGDLQLEMNAEYRFPIYHIFNGAVFYDVGNVWNYRYNEDLPNSNFVFSKFYKQLAMDAGIGLRIDASFLIIRLDLAYAMRNPYQNASGSYWRFNEPFFNNLRLQMGIGYPF